MNGYMLIYLEIHTKQRRGNKEMASKDYRIEFEMQTTIDNVTYHIWLSIHLGKG